MAQLNRSHYAPGSHLNKWVFSCRRNVISSMPRWQSSAGKVFQNLGPATAKLLSPSRVFVRGMIHVSTSADRSRRRPELETSWQSSVRYGAVSPWRATVASEIHHEFQLNTQQLSFARLTIMDTGLHCDNVVEPESNISTNQLMMKQSPWQPPPRTRANHNRK